MENNYTTIPADKLKGVLITKTAIKTLIAEELVEKVISFEFKDALQALKQHHQVEISGFGRFMISPNKTAKKVVKLERRIEYINLKIQNTDMPEGKKNYWLGIIKRDTETIQYLKTRKNGYEN